MKKITSVIIIILLLIVIRGIVISIQELITSNTQADRLSESLQHRKQEREFLKQRLSYVRSDTYIEKEARDKLGLVQPGEKLVLVPSPTQLSNSPQDKMEKPNVEKWIDLFR